VTPPAAAASAQVPQRERARRARPALAPRAPRRVSGPARGADGVSRGPAAAERGLVLGALDVLTGISRHQALDRLIRGRTWIALVAFALIGIVTLQLLVLTLNAHIGRLLVHQAQLQRENAASSIESSELAAGERVESLAARLGMELVQVGDVRFLTVDPRADIARAAAALNEPAGTASTTSTEQTVTATGEGLATAGASSAAAEEHAGTPTADAGAPAPSGTAEPPSSTTEPPSSGSGEQAASAGATPPEQGVAAAPDGAEQPAPSASSGPLEHGGATAGAGGESTNAAG